MSHPELKELTRAEQLFDDGKLDEALELFNDWSQFEGLNSQQKGYYQFLKGLILIYQNKSEEVIELGKRIFREGQKLKNNLQSFDGFFFIIAGLCLANKFDEALKKIEKTEALLRLLSRLSKNILNQRKARISVLKAWINLNTGNIDLAEKCLEGALGLQKELGNTFEIVWANILMAQIMLRVKIRSDLAMEYTKKALSMAKEISFNHYWIAMNYFYFGRIYADFGEFDVSLKHFMKSLNLFKRTKNTFWIATALNSIGGVYGIIGDYDLSLNYCEEALVLYEIQSMGVEVCLDNLIDATLDKGDIERAQKYFDRLENLNNQKKNSQIKLFYQFNKAIMLKRSSRIRDKAKAEELFKQVIETKTVHNEVIRDSLVYLCDLLLAEFRMTNDIEVLKELNHYIAQLLTIAENLHSYRVFCETFILQAKLALLNLDVKAARRFLTQAQKIAESYGIKRLAMKISYEHDELLKQINMWEKLKSSDSPLSERWELAGLSDQMQNMVKKQMSEVPKISDEEPVLLLILSEGGVPFFSHSFIEDKSFKSHLFGGFLTTIDYFIREMFSEGLDRAVFGDYTLLMKSLPPFFISYIFKGDSYYALQKLDYFNEHIRKEDYIREKLLRYFQVNQSIQLKDIPLLDSLITETFLTKNPVFN